MTMQAEVAPKCPCICGCNKPFDAQELAYYQHMETSLVTCLCFDCQNAYEDGRDCETQR